MNTSATQAQSREKPDYLNVCEHPPAPCIFTSFSTTMGHYYCNRISHKGMHSDTFTIFEGINTDTWCPSNGISNLNMSKKKKVLKEKN